MEAFSRPDALYFVNGQQLDSVSVTDRGLAYGDGLFETLRFRKKCLPAWPYHLKRLSRGAEVLQLSLDVQRVDESVQTALDHAQRQNIVNGVLKLMVTRGSGGRGYLPPGTGMPTVIVVVKPYVPMSLIPGTGAVELKSCTYRLSHNPVLAGLKHLNRLEHVLAAQSADLQPGHEGLVFDRDDCVVETLHHNLFLVKAGALITPDLSQCGVAGVMRSAIMEVFAPHLSLSVQSGRVEQSALKEADEVFICNGVHGVTPVCQWQDSIWPTGEITRQLMQNISEHWTGFYER